MTYINYELHNYCSKCDFKYLKIVVRCPVCNNQLRTKRRRIIYDYLARRKLKNKKSLQM